MIQSFRGVYPLIATRMLELSGPACATASEDLKVSAVKRGPDEKRVALVVGTTTGHM